MTTKEEYSKIEKAARDFVAAYIGDSATTSETDAMSNKVEVEFPWPFRAGDEVRVGVSNDLKVIEHVDYLNSIVTLEEPVESFVPDGHRFTYAPVIEAAKSQKDGDGDVFIDGDMRPDKPFVTTQVFGATDTMLASSDLKDVEYQHGYEEHTLRQKEATLSITFYAEYHKELAARFENALASDTMDFRVDSVLPYGVTNFSLASEEDAYSFDRKHIADYRINYEIEGVAPQPGQSIDKVDSTGKVADIDTDVEAE